MNLKIIFICQIYAFQISSSQVTFPESAGITTQATTTSTVTTSTTTRPPIITTSSANPTSTTPARSTSSSSLSITTTVRTGGTTQPNNCICVPDNSCKASLGGNLTLSDGGGQINPRIVNPSRLPSSTFGTNDTVTTPTSTGISIQTASPTSCTIDSLELCCPKEVGFKCGISYPPVNGSATQQGRAYFGQFPWQGIIFTSEQSYVGTGVLIDQFNFVTVAHRLDRFSGSRFKVRMGDWDTSTRNEPIPYMEFNVSRVVVHPRYNSINLQNNIAVMKLSSAVPLGLYPTISITCLPATPILPPMRCWVSGWGRNDFYFGSNQPQQRAVDLPIVDFNQCEYILRQTKLGRNFILDKTSFMCAGGEPGKDACTGDGGAPLVCFVKGQWFTVGLVGWGISCAQNVPGVYINITNYIPWIQNVTRLP